MIAALRRYGVPQKMLVLIANIYSDRRFYVSDGHRASGQRRQRSGIAQGCPLSPFLFVMVMTILMKDATDKLGQEARTDMETGNMSILLYADDTLLVGRSQQYLQELLDAVAWAGARAGMELHWDKFQLIEIGCDIRLRTPEGREIPAQDHLSYLGATLYSSGCVAKELNKRLGAAWAEFVKYERAWKHTAVDKYRKIQMFQALITSKVLYSLSTAWLNQSEKRRLDGFQAKCLRRVLHIPPSFLSRVSNKAVLQQARQDPYSTQLLRQQLALYGKIGRASNRDFLRRVTFQPDTVLSATDALRRRRGRPQREWANGLYRMISPSFDSHALLLQCVQDPVQWDAFVKRHTQQCGDSDGQL